MWSIATYLPREGPETPRYSFLKFDFQVCIAPYLPRKGPETGLISFAETT